MAYCTSNDLTKAIPEATLIQLTDDDGAGLLDAEKIEDAIDSAAEEIDSWIGARVGLPITGTAPPILGKLNADMAIYNLYSRVMEEIPDVRSERYQNACRILAKIAEGKISLGIQPEPEAPSAGTYAQGAQSNVRDKVFTATEMAKY